MSGEQGEPQQTNPLQAILGLVAMGLMGWYFWGGGIEKKVSQDAIKQYEIAKRGGSAIDACVQAGIVSASFLQAKDESNYQQWKEQEERDCRRAGIR